MILAPNFFPIKCAKTHIDRKIKQNVKQNVFTYYLLTVSLTVEGCGYHA